MSTDTLTTNPTLIGDLVQTISPLLRTGGVLDSVCSQLTSQSGSITVYSTTVSNVDLTKEIIIQGSCQVQITADTAPVSGQIQIQCIIGTSTQDFTFNSSAPTPPGGAPIVIPFSFAALPNATPCDISIAIDNQITGSTLSSDSTNYVCLVTSQ